MERSMHTLQATPVVFSVPKKAPWLMTALICGAVLSLTAATSDALDLVAFAGIAGPLTAALTQLASLAPSVKALIGFIGFVVALVSLAGLRNFGPVLFYLGLAIFAAVGLVIAGAIMGAVLPMV
jgi:hypothetical protein